MCFKNHIFSTYRNLYIAANQVLKPYNRTLEISKYKLDSNREPTEYINTMNDIAKIISNAEYSQITPNKTPKSTS